MEKLIPLLNERHNLEWVLWSNVNWDYLFVKWDKENKFYEEQIISKKFWFIERLMKNNKIRNDGIKPRKDLVKEITIIDYQTNKAIWWKNKYTEVEQLLMYLSIQDSPIKCLISILKQDD